MVTVFVLEDDRDLNAVICRHLEMNCYHTVSCLSVQDAYDAMENTHYDAFISDIMMPGEDGFSFAREIRTRDADVPILFMTAYDSLENMRRGYQLGIDDYMPKPVNLDEMELRLSALLRRARIAAKKQMVIGNLTLDEASMTAELFGAAVPLSVREFKLLFTLLSYPGKAFSRAQLLEAYNGLDSESSLRSVDVFITGIRAKFAACDAFRIESVRGLGYRAVIIANHE